MFCHLYRLIEMATGENTGEGINLINMTFFKQVEGFFLGRCGLLRHLSLLELCPVLDAPELG